MGNLVLFLRNTATGTRRATDFPCLWKFHQGITVNLMMIHCCLKLLHVALLTEVGERLCPILLTTVTPFEVKNESQ